MVMELHYFVPKYQKVMMVGNMSLDPIMVIGYIEFEKKKR